MRQVQETLRKRERVISEVIFYETLYPILITIALCFDVRGSSSGSLFPSVICIHHCPSCLQVGVKAEIFLFWYFSVCTQFVLKKYCMMKEESLFNEESMLTNQKKIDSIVNLT